MLKAVSGKIKIKIIIKIISNIYTTLVGTSYCCLVTNLRSDSLQPQEQQHARLPWHLPEFAQTHVH